MSKQIECTHDASSNQSFQVISATEGYFAAYQEADQKMATLNNIVAWRAVECAQCLAIIVQPLVVKPYAKELVAAHEIPNLITVVGPTPHADQKSKANTLVEQEKQIRNDEAMHRALSRRAVMPVR